MFAFTFPRSVLLFMYHENQLGSPLPTELLNSELQADPPALGL